MKSTVPALAAAVLLFASACSGSSNALVFGPFNAEPNSSSSVASDTPASDAGATSLGAPSPDPAYGAPFGIGGTFQPSTVPGF